MIEKSQRPLRSTMIEGGFNQNAHDSFTKIKNYVDIFNSIACFVLVVHVLHTKLPNICTAVKSACFKRIFGCNSD